MYGIIFSNNELVENDNGTPRIFPTLLGAQIARTRLFPDQHLEIVQVTVKTKVLRGQEAAVNA